jgi:hypothetical protein
MVVVSRSLKLRQGESEIDIPIRVFSPRSDGGHWACEYEIDWPEGKRRGASYGYDSVQALLLALSIIGSELYTSDYHKAGKLESGNSWKGYGFPVPQNLRDLLIGDDAEYF